ncbi:RecQ-mediated genome instability protein 1 [Armadillidium nasatum]|uniref:RecQ-mediated genome instability protein 1 n=1 Tax=Armadillidium nasatum TaxID=96803 RepID=A0A5N5T0X2_9CRUS|nr:RecQ-mediated genome instability protein 1 [Armadillidium nasatum]
MELNPLQINHIKDIGLPAYSQLQKLRKDDVENTNVSAEKNFTQCLYPLPFKSQFSKLHKHYDDYNGCLSYTRLSLFKAAWEPKPSRMLLLQLTDGTTVVQGMEYKPINSLSLAMKPGVKILLKGSIETRRGILLLTSSNVTVLGGEVESLLLTNAPENIMRRTLRLEESDSPIPVPENFVPTATQENATQSQYYNTQSSQINSFPNTFHGANKLPQTQSFKNIPSSIATNNQFDDDLDDFIDLETEKAILEAEQKASSMVVAKNQTNPLKRDFSSTSNSVFNTKKPSNGLVNYTAEKNFGNSNSDLQFINDTFDNDMDFDDYDEELLLAAAEVEIIENNPPSSSNSFRQIPLKKTFASGNDKSRQTSLSDFCFKKKEKEKETNIVVNPVDHRKDIKTVLQTKPYQYICYLNLHPKDTIIYTVKGFFTTLLSKIEQNDGKWNLAAKINDGTGSCDVDIDDSVLRDLIEMSVEEFKVQKQLALNNVQLRSTLAQRVIRCQMELIRACCILQLEVSPSLSKPKVTKLIPLLDIHLKQLKERAIL